MKPWVPHADYFPPLDRTVMLAVALIWVGAFVGGGLIGLIALIDVLGGML